MMESARADLMRPFLSTPLSERVLEQVSTYLELLQKWNARINLTAIRDEAGILTRHFGESFFLAQRLFNRNVATAGPGQSVQDTTQDTTQDTARNITSGTTVVVDIGSGAGFPAIPIKLWAEEISLTMIEANHKKAAFLREVIRSLALENVQVISDRAEIVAAKSDFPRADVVTFRAVEHFDDILKTAFTLLAPGGRLGLLIGSGQWKGAEASPDMIWDDPIAVPLAESRVVRIGRKAA